MFRYFCPQLALKILASGIKLEGIFDNKTNQLVEGIATTKDGRVYKGSFDAINGRPLPGTQLEEDGDLYIGDYNENWQRHGKGEAFLLDGTHFKGNFHNDELVEGEVRVPQGMKEVVFNGTLKDEMFHNGTLHDHEYTYTGIFKNNIPHGKGKLIFSSGAEQEGIFYEGKLHGSNCRLKLESGFVYVGDFNHGIIRKGQLFTSVYHYDGEFSDDGRANGEGVQTYLASNPKLIFTGIWSNGNLIRGTCSDENGNPIDWMDNHDLRKEVLGAKITNSDIVSKCVFEDVKKRTHEIREAYYEDSSEICNNTGKFPSKNDLGYQPKSTSQTNNSDSISNVLYNASKMHYSKDYKNKMYNIERSMQDINPHLAKKTVTEQLGCQELRDIHLAEQLKKFQSKKEKNMDELRIDQNFAWRSSLDRSQ